MSHAKLAQEAGSAQWLYLTRLAVLMLIAFRRYLLIRYFGLFEWTHAQKDEAALMIMIVVCRMPS